MAKSSEGRDALAGRWRLMLWGAIAGLLLLPLIAMQFTREVAWTASDFAAAALLLGGAGLAFEIVVRVTSKAPVRWAIGAALLALVGLIWAQGAVEIV